MARLRNQEHSKLVNKNENKVMIKACKYSKKCKSVSDVEHWNGMHLEEQIHDEIDLYDDDVVVIGDSSSHCDFGPPLSPEERTLRRDEIVVDDGKGLRQTFYVHLETLAELSGVIYEVFGKAKQLVLKKKKIGRRYLLLRYPPGRFLAFLRFVYPCGKSIPLRLTDDDPLLMVTAVKVAFDLRGYRLSQDCCFYLQQSAFLNEFQLGDLFHHFYTSRRRVDEFREDTLYRAVCTHASRVFSASEIQRFGEQFADKPVGYDILLCNALRIEEEKEADRGWKKVKSEMPFKMDCERHMMIRQRFSD